MTSIWKRYGHTGYVPSDNRPPPIAVGQVWHFPTRDIDVKVIFRRGDAYLVTGPDTYIKDRLTDEDCGTNTTDEYTSSPPEDNGEVGWLVSGPGAPWRPPGA